MHQKTVVAASLALAGLVGMGAVHAQSKVELWGIVDSAIRHTNNEGANKGTKTQMIGGGMSQSRWGVNVEEDMGGGNKALVVLENRFTSDNGNATPDMTPGVPGPFFQLSYVGLQGPYGRLTMGRQWNVLFDVVTSTYASFPYSPYMDAYKPELGMAVTGRSSNSLKYNIANADRSFAAGLQYSFAERNNTAKLEETALSNTALTAYRGSYTSALAAGAPGATTLATIRNGITSNINGTAPTAEGVNIATGAMQQLGGFLRFSKNGYSLGGGYLRTELPGGSDLDAWTLGGSYRSGSLYLNLGYGSNTVKRVAATGNFDNYVRGTVRRYLDQKVLDSMWGGQTSGGFQAGDADKRQMVKIGFGYQITPQINAGMHYFHAKQSGSATGKSTGKANFVVAAVDYAFSKRTDAYFAVDNTRVSGGADMYIDSDSKSRSRTGITAGLRHRF